MANLDKARALWENRYNELLAKFKAAGGAPPPPVAAIALPADLDRLLREWAAKYPDLVEYDALRGMVKFKTDLLFASGSDDVSAKGKSALKLFGDIIKSAEAVQFHIYIVGHTDDQPIKHEQTRRMHPTNWYLSVHRGVSVMKELATGGVQEVRMGVMGFGEFHPIAANASGHKGNPLNRRVEIWIVPPEKFLTVPMGVEMAAAKASPAEKSVVPAAAGAPEPAAEGPAD